MRARPARHPLRGVYCFVLVSMNIFRLTYYTIRGSAKVELEVEVKLRMRMGEKKEGEEKGKGERRKRKGRDGKEEEKRKASLLFLPLSKLGL